MKGTVKDNNGVGLIGVTIRVKVPRPVPPPEQMAHLQSIFPRKDTLVFSYLGYVSQEVKAGAGQQRQPQILRKPTGTGRCGGLRYAGVKKT